MQSVLFILKGNVLPYQDTESGSPQYRSSGLMNSASFVVNALREAGVEANIEIAIDNNCIDRLVRQYNPKYVIIEALWVVPSKFKELIPLHPNVEWIVRLHSETVFLSQEGISYEWIRGYDQYPQVHIACNSYRNKVETDIFTSKPVLYLPNYYPTNSYIPGREINKHKDTLDIGCFGAIRPLKNQVAQGIAAIAYAKEEGKKLRFHINGSRLETGGQPVLKSLRGLFSGDPTIELVEHLWMDHDTFVKLLETLDITMQVSLSETFNIVSADSIIAGTPIVTSPELMWTHSAWQADPTDFESIVKAIRLAYDYPKLNVCLNRRGLKKYDRKSIEAWFEWLS
jgi:glycosyltransferase involved in cell wall biosynthesis